MLATMLREEASVDSVQPEPLSVLPALSVLDGVPDGWCSGHRRSQSVTFSVRALARLTSVDASMQITRMPLNGIMTSSAPSVTFRI